MHYGDKEGRSRQLPKPLICVHGNTKYIVFPYAGFSQMGVATSPPVPMVAVPLFDDVNQAVKSAAVVSTNLDYALAKLNVQRADKSLRESGFYSGLEDAPLGYTQKLHFPFVLFRGESREQHGIMPSIYRFLQPHGADDLIAKRRRIESRSTRIMQIALSSRTVTQCSPDQARAAARHYGIASSLIDFSFSPHVAAYFAHPSLCELEKRHPENRQIGIIYCLTMEHLTGLFGIQGMKPLPEHGVDIFFLCPPSQWQVPYLAYDPISKHIAPAIMIINTPKLIVTNLLTIRCIPVPSIRRIAAQQGVFVEIRVGTEVDWRIEVLLWYLLDFVTHKWCFFREDNPYNNPSERITECDLFPDDGPRIQRAEKLLCRLSKRTR